MHITRTIPAAFAALLCTASVAGAQTPSLDSLSMHAFQRRTLVQVDSVRIEVAHDTIGWKTVPTEDCFALRPDTSVHGGSAQVRVLMPAGTFTVRADSATIAAWADSATTLRGPVVVKAKGGGKSEVSLSGVLLREVDGVTVMRIVRLTSEGDSLPAYQLDASNGAWGGGVRLRPEQVRALFDALRGTAPFTAAEADVANFDFQVDVPVRQLAGPSPLYPRLAQEAGQESDVQLSYVVGTDGRAEPGSLEVTGSTLPEFAVAVRESVLHRHFAPATRGGAPVRMHVQQRFSFRVR